ncbi:uncharacterized protein LOC123307335 [Coccinella septempunctata]|uniref:uncharacterized protein LOC123307335 n=1 Tax=Coccinella septempunctata TaxID=41139 RepID=UPI001D06AF2C|nr:uncharacterized protein LOC123307335 [Coccinella septempunctata]
MVGCALYKHSFCDIYTSRSNQCKQKEICVVSLFLYARMMANNENGVFLSFKEYSRYLGSIPTSRNLLEGGAVLNAGHIMMCGNLGKSSRVIEVFGLCLQTSAPSSDPHEIKGKL